MKKKIILAMVIMVVTAGAVLGLSLLNSSKNSIKYKTEAVTRGDIEAIVVTSGTVNPVTLVDVGSQVSGTIAKLYADFDSHVQKGQILAELDKAPFETEVKQKEANYQLAMAALEKANVDLDNAKKKYDRTLDLFEKNLVSKEDKETDEEQYLSAKDDVKVAQDGLEEAKAELDSSRVDLSNTIIRSPIDGIVISREVNVGQTVASKFQTPVLFRIANDLSTMRVECDVDEGDVGQVKEGQKALFTVEAYPDETFAGRIIQVRYGADIDQNVVTYTALVEIDNPEAKLMPGMTATVTIITGEAKNVLRVPNEALRFKPPSPSGAMKDLTKDAGLKPEGKNSESSVNQPSFVWREEPNGKLTPVLIVTGLSDSHYTEVLKGDLKEGQVIITGLESEGS